jgi:hypothetical protein
MEPPVSEYSNDRSRRLMLARIAQYGIDQDFC